MSQEIALQVNNLRVSYKTRTQHVIALGHSRRIWLGQDDAGAGIDEAAQRTGLDRRWRGLVGRKGFADAGAGGDAESALE